MRAFFAERCFFNERTNKQKAMDTLWSEIKLHNMTLFSFSVLPTSHQNTKLIPKNWHRKIVIEYQILLPSDFTLPNFLLGKTQILK